MIRFLTPFLAALAVLTPGADAQSKASAELFTRVEDGELRFAIEIEVAEGFHLYHHELGASDSVGKPLRVEVSGDFEQEGELIWPVPHRYEQLGIGDGGGDTFILGHEGAFVIFGRGTVESGTSPALEAELDGLACQDDGICLPYRETIESKGEGRDALWADFPEPAGGIAADIVAPPEEGFGDNAFGMGGGESGGGGFGVPGGGGSSSDAKASARLHTRTVDGDVQIAITIEIDDRYHLYHEELGAPDAIGRPTIIELSGGGLEFSELLWPVPHRYEQPGIGDGGRDTFILGHAGEIVIYGLGEGSGKAGDVVAELNGQTCEDDGVCLQYAEEIETGGEGPAEIWAGFPTGDWAAALAQRTDETRAVAQPAPAGAEEGEAPETGGEEDGGLWALILGAIGGGIFALLMPCTYPMIPITISFFTKQAEARGGNVLALSLLYGAGIVLIFVAIALTVGSLIMPFATHPVTNMVMGLVFVIFAAALFGVITLNPPQSLMNMAGKASATGGLLGVFLMGMTLVLTSFTCTAPFVGSLLSASAAEGHSLWEITLGMGVFGLTMAVPFTALALVPGKLQAMPSSGEWMNTLKVTLGFVELAAALKFFSNVDLGLEWNFLSRELFLLLWALIFVLAGLYLLGWIKIKGYSVSEVSAGRMMSAAFFLALAAYCWHGYRGHRMDVIMTAIIPPYSSAPGTLASGEGGAVDVTRPEKHVVVKDDFEAAKARALAENKALIVNFTGHL